MVDFWSKYGEGPERPLVPGALRGYRQLTFAEPRVWIDLRGKHHMEPAQILSPQQRHVWSVRDNQASCPNRTIVGSSSECAKCDEYMVGKFTSYDDPYDDEDAECSIDMWCSHIGYYSPTLNSYYSMSPPRRTITATLKLGTHPAPTGGCTCGFYGTYNLSHLMSAPGINWMGYRYSFETPRAKLVAVVEAHGKVVLAESGFRAEKMNIIALAPMSGKLPSRLHELMPEVELFDNAAKMYKKYPPQGVKELVPEANLDDSYWRYDLLAAQMGSARGLMKVALIAGMVVRTVLFPFI